MLCGPWGDANSEPPLHSIPSFRAGAHHCTLSRTAVACRGALVLSTAASRLGPQVPGVETVLSEVFRKMEALTRGEGGRPAALQDWGIEQMNLETVFLKLCPASEDDLASIR